MKWPRSQVRAPLTSFSSPHLSQVLFDMWFLFRDLFDKLLVARFDQPHYSSSDRGAVLLKEAGKVYGPARCGTR